MPVSGKYLCYFLLSNTGKGLLLNETFGSAQQVINLKDINKLIVLLPREKSEQEAIEEIRAVGGKLSEARAVKAGMMSALLTGRARLV